MGAVGHKGYRYVSEEKNDREKTANHNKCGSASVAIARALATAYRTSEAKDALSVPYVITCAATLEAMLNDALTNYVRQTWRDNGSGIGQAYFSMSFRGKLEMVPVLLTHEKFRLNRDDEYVKRLHALISARNLLVHPKPSSHEVDGVPHPIYGENAFLPGAEYLELVEDYTFGAKHDYTPEQYHEALDKFDKWFFRRLHGDISKVRLLSIRSEN